jgi:hypothetical protein
MEGARVGAMARTVSIMAMAGHAIAIIVADAKPD